MSFIVRYTNTEGVTYLDVIDTEEQVEQMRARCRDLGEQFTVEDTNHYLNPEEYLG